MITCSVTIYPVIKAKPAIYPDLVCQPDAISVDSNNVQTQPLRIHPVTRIGGLMEAMKAYIRVTVKAGDMELGQAESGAPLSEWDYYLPSDKWGEADNVMVTTYEDPSYATRLTEKQVSILRQHATPFPIEGDWRPKPFKYKNGEYFIDNERNLVYQWMNPVAGNSDVHPFEDIKNNPNVTSWKQHTEWVLLATQVFLANFAKLGSAVFNGDYTISQHGKDADGRATTDYRNFGKKDSQGRSVFTPNFAIDWLLGKAIGMDMDIQGGKIGNLRVENNRLKSDTLDSSIEIEGSKNRMMRLGGEYGSLISLRIDGAPDGLANTGVSVESYGKENVCLRLLANSNSRFAIDSVGPHHFYQREGEIWDAPGVLYAGHYGGDGSKHFEWGQGAGSVRCEYLKDKEVYRIYHEINRLDYFVSIIPFRLWTFATMQAKDPKMFDFTIADPNRGLQKMEFDVMIFGRNVYKNYYTK